MTDYENIPDELRLLSQWVCVRADSKAPMQTFCNAAASSTDPRTWSCFADAWSDVIHGPYDYIGFVFNNNGIVGIDIDAGYDEDGFISALAADIIVSCESYTEKSRSGRGFHVLVKGDLPFKGKNNLRGVEIYKQARYFIMTGNVVLYPDLIENQAAIDYIVDKYFPEMRESETGKSSGPRIYTPIWERPRERIKLRPVYPRIPDGSRNICLTSLAGMLHNQGYSPAQIRDELLYCNTVACDPMLPAREVESIVKSVVRYKR